MTATAPRSSSRFARRPLITRTGTAPEVRRERGRRWTGCSISKVEAMLAGSWSYRSVTLTLVALVASVHPVLGTSTSAGEPVRSVPEEPWTIAALTSRHRCRRSRRAGALAVAERKVLRFEKASPNSMIPKSRTKSRLDDEGELDRGGTVLAAELLRVAMSGGPAFLSGGVPSPALAPSRPVYPDGSGEEVSGRCGAAHCCVTRLPTALPTLRELLVGRRTDEGDSDDDDGSDQCNHESVPTASHRPPPALACRGRCHQVCAPVNMRRNMPSTPFPLTHGPRPR